MFRLRVWPRSSAGWSPASSSCSAPSSSTPSSCSSSSCRRSGRSSDTMVIHLGVRMVSEEPRLARARGVRGWPYRGRGASAPTSCCQGTGTRPGPGARRALHKVSERGMMPIIIQRQLSFWLAQDGWKYGPPWSCHFNCNPLYIFQRYTLFSFDRTSGNKKRHA